MDRNDRASSACQTLAASSSSQDLVYNGQDDSRDQEYEAISLQSSSPATYRSRSWESETGSIKHNVGNV